MNSIFEFIQTNREFNLHKYGDKIIPKYVIDYEITMYNICDIIPGCGLTKSDICDIPSETPNLTAYAKDKHKKWKNSKKRKYFLENNDKGILYKSRKLFADTRPRIGGRFIKKNNNA